MSKKPRKTSARDASKAASRKPAPAATKRPAAAVRTRRDERIARALEAIAAHLSAGIADVRGGRLVRQRRRLCLAPERTAGAGAARQPRRSRPAQGHRPDARYPDREYRTLRQRPARQQRAAMGRARHGQIVAGQGGACQHQRRPQAGRPAEADRNPSRGYREPAGADGRCCARSEFHFIVFCDDLSFDGNDASYKSLKAVLEGGIEGRPDNVILYATSNRRHLLRARHDRERTLDRDQSRRSGRGESLAVGSLRPVARLSSLQPGRIPRDGEGLLRPLRHQARRRRTRTRSAGMVDHARLALGPRRLAVHAGIGGTAGRKAERRSRHRARSCLS